MKKLSKLAALLAAGIAAVFVAACSNVAGNVNPVSNEIVVPAATKAVTLNASTEDDNLLTFVPEDTNEAARMIVPDQLQSDEIFFYLKGENLNGGGHFIMKQVNFRANSPTDLTKGKVSVEIPPAYYKFTLYASKSELAVDPSSTWGSETITYDSGAKSDWKTQIVLVGFANADLRYSETVQFYLSADNVTKADDITSAPNGSILLGFYATDKWDFTNHPLSTPAAGAGSVTISAYLESIVDGSLVGAATAITPADFEASIEGTGHTADYSKTDLKTKTAADLVAAGHKDVVFENTSIAPGTYNIVLKFVVSGGKTYYFADKIIVLPGQRTVSEVPVPPVMEYAPEMPTNFFAYWFYNTANVSDYYDCYFKWKDNSANEEYFELQIADLSASLLESTPVVLPIDDAALTAAGNAAAGDPSKALLLQKGANSAADTAWDDVFTTLSITATAYDPETNTGNVYTYKTDFYGNQNIWAAGSLQKNNTFCVAKLELGKRYLARIRSHNAAGDSEYSYVYLNSGDLSPAVAPPSYTGGSLNQFTKIADGSGDDTGSLNVFRLKYNKNGGEFASTPWTAIADTALVTYVNQNAVAGNTILSPDGFESNVNLLRYNKGTVGEPSWIPWSYWKINTAASARKPNVATDRAELTTSESDGSSYAGYVYDYDEAGTVATKFYNNVLYYDTGTTDVANPQPKAAADLTGGAYDVMVKTCKPYMGCKNITLVAGFTNTVMNAEIYSDNDYALDPTKVNITAPASTYLKWSTDKRAVIIARTNNGAAPSYTETWTYDLSAAATAGIVYDKIGFVIKKQDGTEIYRGVSYATSGTVAFTVDGSTLLTGKYIATFEGYRAERPEAPYTTSVFVTLND